MMILTFNINSYAETLPELMITSNNYAVGDKMRYDDVKDVEVEKTLQLYAVIAHGNEMLIDDNYDSLGWFVDEANLSGATSVEKGKDLKIYICPDEGYEIDKVLVDNKAIDLKTLVYEKNNPNATSEDGVAVYTFTNVSKDYTIEAYYKKKSNSDPTKSPVNPGTSEKDSPTTKSDPTNSPTILPKTGENQIIFVLLISSIVIVTFTYMGYKKYKKIG